MKKIIVILFAAAIALSASAQHEARLNVYGSYVFDDSYDSYYDNNNYYNGKISGGFQWGLGVEWVMQTSYCLELMYLNHNTKAPTTYKAGIANALTNTDFDLTLNYVLLGGDYHFMAPSKRVEGYAGMFGGALFAHVENPDNGNSGNATKFAWGVRLGANIMTAGKIGIKLQTQLLSSVQATGGTYYFGIYGSGVGLSTYSTIYQFTLGGGITFRLGK